MTYAKGLSSVPYPLSTPEWDSFKNYAVAYFKEAIEIAKKVAEESPPPGPWVVSSPRLFDYILDKTASPLVFLWEKWQLMSSEQRLPYATQEYKKELEKRIEEVKKTTKKAEQRGFPT